jgi:hypothetical protein
VVHETVQAVKISHHGVEAGDCLGESILIFKMIIICEKERSLKKELGGF